MLENIVVSIWNKFVDRAPPPRQGILLGHEVIDRTPSKHPLRLSDTRRTEHIAIIGKTGTGKTSLLKSMLAQDVKCGKGFICIDLHGDIAPFVLSRIAERQGGTGADLAARTVIFNPSDPSHAVGLNVLAADQRNISVLVSEVVAIVRRRWQLDHFGARTEEFFRNCLWALAENGLTFTELIPFATDLSFRASLVHRIQNAEVKAYFRNRYDQLSDAMQAVIREAVLNKATAFTTDPAIRHIVGQQSKFSIARALDENLWVILSLHKKSLGENSEVLASLLLAQFRNAVFARAKRNLFTLYADELPSLVSSADSFEHLFSQSRKYGISLVTASQHLSQGGNEVRSTLLSAGTTIFFRSSAEDAPQVARFLDGGSSADRQLKELPDRHFLIRSADRPSAEAITPEVRRSAADPANLIYMSNRMWAKPRSEIEREIQGRLHQSIEGKEELEQWK